MKTLIHLFLTFLFLLPIVNAQEEHSYPMRESIFQNWIKRDGQSAYSWGNDYHKVGALLQTYWYEIRNFNSWQWTYNDIPTEATVTSVTLKFRVRKGNYNDTFTFSLHNIPYLLNTPNIDFYNESNSNQIYISSALTPDANKYVYFNMTFTPQSPVGNGQEVWEAINSAVQSGQNFVTLGIRERTSLLLPYWAISAYDGTYTSPYVVDLIINFTTPNNYYTFKNKIQSNESYGSLILNENILHPISSGSAPVFLSWGTSNKIRTDELPFLPNWNGTGTTQKHNYWDLQSDTAFVLRYEFDAISSSPSILKSTFLPTSPAVIKNQIPELDNTSLGTIGLVDPWLYYEDEIGQWIHDVEPHFYSSPFNILNSSISNYGGVFLNQGYNPVNQTWTPPYYSLKIDVSQNIPVTQTNKTHKFYFQKWSGENVNYKFPAALESPVVFTSAGAIAQSNLKGTQLSGISTAFNNSSQRKLVCTSFPDNYYHLVYSSSGSVWYEKTLVNSPTITPINWQLMNDGKPLDGEMNLTEAKSPSIDFVYATHGSQEENYFIYSVYQKKKSDGKYEIRLAKFNQSGSKIFDTQVFSSTYTDFSLFDCMPVIGVSRQADDQAPIKIVVVWKRPVEGSSTAGLYYLAGFDQGSTINWTDSYPNPIKISSTDSYSTNPSLAVFKKPSGSIYYHLAYQQSNSQIKYIPIEFGVNGTGLGSAVVISTGSGSSINISPSITVGNTYTNYPPFENDYDSPKIVWCTGEYGTGVYRYRTNMQTTKWSPFYLYLENDDVQSPTISGPKYHPSAYDDYFHFGWSWLVGYYKSYVATNNLSQKLSLPYQGRDIQIANNVEDWDGFGYVVFDNVNRTTAPFDFENGWVTPTLEKSGLVNIHSGRAGTVINNNAELYFAFGDIKLNDEEISFAELNDTVTISTLNDLNTNLVTNSFNVNDNSILLYSVFYGLNDSSIVSSSLTNSDIVNFRIELIDDQNHQILGVFDNVIQTKQNLVEYENKSYQVDLEGIGNKSVRLRLVVENNFTSEYSLSNVFSFNQALGKTALEKVNWDEITKVKEYALEQNFPNPFNPSTKIKFQIPNDGYVTLKVYDILGNEIATLLNEEKPQGKYELNFNASSLASGVYIYKLQAGDFVSSKKMILLK